jgi:iron complex transport system substrate-binding protein
MFRLCALLLILTLSSCSETGKEHETPVQIKQSNLYATGFSIEVNGIDTLFLLFSPLNQKDTVLKMLIEKPINRFACLSTTHLPFFQSLNAAEKAVGVGFAEYLKDEESLDRIESGSLTNITAAGNLDFERIVSLAPEALLVYYYGNEDYSRYEQAGIKIIPINEYAEAHPLGRAEWLKVFGLLAGKYSAAGRAFNEIDSAYKSLEQSIPSTANKPMVFTGSFYKGKWAAPGGDSFIARFIEDAGAQYAFEDYPGNENINLDFERC